MTVRCSPFVIQPLTKSVFHPEAFNTNNYKLFNWTSKCVGISDAQKISDGGRMNNGATGTYGSHAGRWVQLPQLPQRRFNNSQPEKNSTFHVQMNWRKIVLLDHCQRNGQCRHIQGAYSLHWITCANIFCYGLMREKMFPIIHLVKSFHCSLLTEIIADLLFTNA